MFAKTYKLKSNNTLKNTEKKQLAQKIQSSLDVSEEKAKQLVPTKSNASCMKMTLHSGDVVSVYVVEGVPLAVETADKLIPTVCALWQMTDLLPTITIHTPVLTKLLNGVPLYQPGIVIPEKGVGFPVFPRGAIIAVNTENNGAAAAVGRTVMSSGQMVMGQGGVALEPLHVMGDYLCRENKFRKPERPSLPAPLYCADRLLQGMDHMTLHEHQQDSEWPKLGAPSPAPPGPPADTQPPQVTPPADDPVMSPDDPVICPADPVRDPAEEQDELLMFCLLSFIKLQGKKVELPLKTNLFYRNHLIPLCPSGCSLDVKKSSYKKLSKFLEAMQKESLLEVQQLEKGVAAVRSLNAAHPRLQAHVPAPAPAPAPAPPAYSPPQVREMYTVTAAVQKLFANTKKGTPVTSSEVRESLTRHVKASQLQTPRNKVLVDPLLNTITGKPLQSECGWEEMMSSVTGRMTLCTEMRWADGSVKLLKTKVEPVQMQVSVRCGNKKVTLVSNLETFGFNLVELARICQGGVAASCGVTRLRERNHLMLQGDQTHYVAKLLVEKYGLPKKYLEGADKALLKKNK